MHGTMHIVISAISNSLQIHEYYECFQWRFICIVHCAINLWFLPTISILLIAVKVNFSRFSLLQEYLSYRIELLIYQLLYA